MENFMRWKMMGGRIKLKKEVVPHIFECQRSTVNQAKRSAAKILRIDSLQNIYASEEPQSSTSTSTPREEIYRSSPSSDVHIIEEKKHCLPCLQRAHNNKLSGAGLQCGSGEMLQIKEESGDADMDIGPTTLQHVDTHLRTNQQYLNVFIQESGDDKNNVDGTLCNEVKQEFIEIELMAVDEQKTAQATSTAGAAGSVTVHQDVCIKDKLKDTHLDIGPAAFLHKDSSHRSNQQNMRVVKREDMIAREGNDPVSCDGVEIDSVEDKRTDLKPHPYTCNICQKVFPAKKNYRNHVIYMHASQSYKCDQCGKAFKCEGNLKKHTRSLHSIDGHKKCNVCGKYVKWSYIKRHMLIVHSDKQWLCNVCGETVKSDHCLQLHLLDVHGQQSAKSNIFPCDYCRRTYTTKSVLRTHVRSAHAKGHYKCNQCEKSYRCKQYLILHKANKHTALIKCNVCVKSLKPASMRSHVRRMHGDEQLQCIVCGEEIKSGYCFKQHMNEHCGPPSANSNHQSTCSDIGVGSRASSHPPVGEVNAAASASTQQQDVVVQKEEPADEELELSPIVFQHMDCNYRPYKEEPLLD